MRVQHFLCVLAGTLLTTTLAFAGAPSSTPFNISTPQSFHAQAVQVQAGLKPGGMYGFLSAQNRARVEQKITTMGALFARYGNVEAMNGATRVELYNAQATANWILTRGRNGATRCAWAQQTGSHIPRTLCWSMRA